MTEDGDVSLYVNDNISFSEEFSYTKNQSRFAINALSKLYNIINYNRQGWNDKLLQIRFYRIGQSFKYLYKG